MTEEYELLLDFHSGWADFITLTSPYNFIIV